MSEKRKLKKIVDIETDEVDGYIEEGDVLIKGKDQIRNFREGDKFVKLFDGVNDLRKYLNNSGEFCTAMSLADFVCYDDAILRTGGHKNGKKLGIEDLSELMDIPYGTLKRNIMNLNRKGVINYSREGSKKDGYVGETIVVNPYIYLRGKHINSTALGLFERSNWN